MIPLADMNFGLVISDAEIETGKIYFVLAYQLDDAESPIFD
jgi:hypothetical protein